ncbi:hypothetical protein L596_002753 [Steinernema carpocapsae]|uniref:Amidase domain-containing protein n=1 Tax=Steinernema carpocapsae TaxID=34508 RepID=A0A4U8UQI2_STECR|nr:hypothetical protein L596_002753 [Steinernema carpocapsae]
MQMEDFYESNLLAKWLRIILSPLMALYCILVNLFFGFKHYQTKRKGVPPISNDLLFISATDAVEKLAKRELRSLDLVNAYIDRIEEVNKTIVAAVNVDYEAARDQARQCDKFLDQIADNDEQLVKLLKEKPLYGVPITIKECIKIKGFKCTAGIKCRKDSVSEVNATVVERVLQAGAIIIASTNVPEMCARLESINNVYGQTRNPYDYARTAGGSSGGEGSLIGAGGSLFGIGSDFAGSIRLPSFFNGIFGLKPTGGVVPLDGHIPKISTIRQQMLCIGPMSRYAKDLSLLLHVIADPEHTGKMNLTSTVDLTQIKVFYMEKLVTPLCEDVHDVSLKSVHKVIKNLATSFDVAAHRLDLPLAHFAWEMFYACADLGTRPFLSEYMVDCKGDVNLYNELLKAPFGKSDHSTAIILLGILEKQSVLRKKDQSTLSLYRDRLKRELSELLSKNGVLIFPSFPCPIPFHGQMTLKSLNAAYACLWNVLGLPVVQCPLGLDFDGLPTGVQIIGAPYNERLIVEVAKHLEQRFGGWAAPK